MMKTCFKCGETKPISEFYAHRRMADRVLGKCKTCTKTDVRDRSRVEHEKIVAYEAKRNTTPERKATLKAAVVRYRKKNPEKIRARSAVSNAIRDGRLVRGSCEVCGGAAQAHHADYAKPLDVRWFCRTHHHLHHEFVRDPPAEPPADLFE